jgi:hypothetical protein
MSRLRLLGAFLVVFHIEEKGIFIDRSTNGFADGIAKLGVFLDFTTSTVANGFDR